MLDRWGNHNGTLAAHNTAQDREEETCFDVEETVEESHGDWWKMVYGRACSIVLTEGLKRGDQGHHVRVRRDGSSHTKMPIEGRSNISGLDDYFRHTHISVYMMLQGVSGDNPIEWYYLIGQRT